MKRIKVDLPPVHRGDQNAEHLPDNPRLFRRTALLRSSIASRVFGALIDEFLESGEDVSLELEGYVLEIKVLKQ